MRIKAIITGTNTNNLKCIGLRRSVSSCNTKSRLHFIWVLQVMLLSACSFIVEVSCHCFTLHVSAYTAIFRCVGCYYSHVLEGICFTGFFCILHVVTLLYVSICVLLFYFFSFYFAVSCVCLSVCLFMLFSIVI
jgi:hypothetical protein